MISNEKFCLNISLELPKSIIKYIRHMHMNGVMNKLHAVDSISNISS